jgi:hypothetical protein
MKWSLLLLLLSACIATAAPRFPPDVAQALAERPMRRLETQSLYIYYPEGRGEEARRVGERLEGCIAGLRMRVQIRNRHSDEKMVVLLPEVPFNNAFVAPTAIGFEDVAVIPTVNTWDFQTELGIPPDPSFIGCHEITHYVHERQVAGFWHVINALFGEIITPQIGLDAWFLEGLATYYESYFQPGVGRMAWPIWRGYFHAGVAGQGVSGGDFNENHRHFHFANHYLYGSHFIDFLIERYGEQKLWQLIARQGESWAFFLAVNWRFYGVYGRSLSSLIDDFSDWTRHKYPVRPRPPEQQELRRLGSDVRWSRAPGGREAFVLADVDRPTELWIYEPDGQRRRQRRLNELLPWRRLSQANPVVTSGVSFTADGKAVYMTIVDPGLVENEVRLLRYDIDADRLDVVVESLGGPGGSVSPDGRTFWFALAEGDRHHLAALDLATRKVTLLRRTDARQYVGAIRPSPDGTRLALSVFDGKRFTVWIVEAATGKQLAELPGTGSLAEASWADDHRVLYLAESERTFQVFVHDVDTPGAAPQQVTHAPYLTFAPRIAGDRVRFLDREGWTWDLDEAPLPPPVKPEPQPEPAPAPENAPVGTATQTPPPPPAAAPAQPPAPITAPLRVESDEPYSAFDHFFYPQLRTITLAGNVRAPSWGLSFGGGDRLAFHRWGVAGFYQTETKLWSGYLSYANSQLAPWFIQATGLALRWREKLEGQLTTELNVERAQLDGQLTIWRSWGGLDLAFGAVGTSDAVRDYNDGMPFEWDRLRMAGGQLGIGWAAADGSRYAGAQRLLAARADVTYYPEPLSSLTFDLTDTRGELRWRFPPPLLVRHNLELRGRGREMLGAPTGSRYLQLGGAADVAAIVGALNSEPGPGYQQLPGVPPKIAFYEPLRGFENFPLWVDGAAVLDVTYSYPFIIDYGWATSLYLFPAFFIRQINLELFGASALDLGEGPDMAEREPADRVHAAAGGALVLHTVFWRIPVGLKYQIARRLTDDREIEQEFGLGLTF